MKVHENGSACSCDAEQQSQTFMLGAPRILRVSFTIFISSSLYPFSVIGELCENRLNAYCGSQRHNKPRGMAQMERQHEKPQPSASALSPEH